MDISSGYINILKYTGSHTYGYGWQDMQHHQVHTGWL